MKNTDISQSGSTEKAEGLKRSQRARQSDLIGEIVPTSGRKHDRPWFSAEIVGWLQEPWLRTSGYDQGCQEVSDMLWCEPRVGLRSQ